MSRDRRVSEVESLLGSRGRIRVLRVLSEGGELNISEVTRRVGMNHSSVAGHLERLKGMGLVREKRYGKIRIFEAVFNSLIVRFDRGQGVSLNVEA